ncbi:TPA: hypothetical protein DCX15_05070, partial [bacterium]|nr:hypothetical protein [bacterium]
KSNKDGLNINSLRTRGYFGIQAFFYLACIVHKLNSIDLISCKSLGVNERVTCRKFTNWRDDNEAQLWLKIMGYDLKEIDSVEVALIPTRMKIKVLQISFENSNLLRKNCIPATNLEKGQNHRLKQSNQNHSQHHK